MESKSRPWRLSGRTFCCSPASSSSNSSIALSSSSRAWRRVSKARLSCCALSLLPTIGVSYNLTWQLLHYLYSLDYREEKFSETQFVPLLILRNPIYRVLGNHVSSQSDAYSVRTGPRASLFSELPIRRILGNSEAAGHKLSVGASALV